MHTTANEPIWTPTLAKNTRLAAFRHFVNRKYDLSLNTYKDVHAWSVDQIPQFSEAVFDFVGMTTSTPYDQPVDGLDTMYPPPNWFPGANLNYAENMLRPGLATRPNGIAVSCVDEGSIGKSQDYTFKQLEKMTELWASALRSLGVQVGDRVAGEPIASKMANP